MARQKGTLRLRDAVKQADERLWHRLETVWQQAEAGILEVQKSSLGHAQGLIHVKAVEDNLSALIPDEWKQAKLTPLELFLLSASACLHDAGKAGDSPGDHGHVSAQLIRNDPQLFGLRPGEADAVACLVHAHNDKRLDELPADPFPVQGATEVHLRPLAALLCLADALHCDESRVSSQMIATLSPESRNRSVTRFRQLVRAWVFDDQGRIQIRARARNLSDRELYHEGFEALRRELEPVIPTLVAHGYPCNLAPFLEEIEIVYEATHAVSRQRGLPGMDFYHEEDAHIFKGREKDVERLYLTILTSPMSLLIADSGMGKSSLVSAGLFPFLDTFGTWTHVWTRPGTNPTKPVVSDLQARLLHGSPPADETILHSLEVLSSHFPRRKVLVVLDQFEEIADTPTGSLEDLKNSLVAVLAGRFNNLRVLLVYRADAEGRLGPWLQQVSGSTCSPPRTYLSSLDDEGALKALRAGLDLVQIGCPDDLLSQIQSDIKAEGKDLYPPFLQMVGETLANAARRGDSIITRELYESLGGASRIIADYLINRLREFGQDRPFAERVLKALALSTGRKGRGSLDELQRVTQISLEQLKALVETLVDMRMVRDIGSNEYEIIHDHFAELVASQLISDEERRVKQLRELLASKAAAFMVTRTPLSEREMIQLYLIKEQLTPDAPERAILLQSCMGELGPAWYWLTSIDKTEYLATLKNALSHPLEKIVLNAFSLLTGLLGHDALPFARQLAEHTAQDIKNAALTFLAESGSADDLQRIVNALLRPSYYPEVREAAGQAVGRLADRDVLPVLIDMLGDKDPTIKHAITSTIAHWSTVKDLSRLLPMLRAKNRETRAAAAEVIAEVNTRNNPPAVWGMLKKHKYEIRRAAARALAEIATKDDLHRLLELLRDRDAEVRRSAVRAIAHLATHDDLPTFRELLGDLDWRVKEGACEAIAEVGDHDECPRLVEMVKDPQREVRSAAGHAVARLASRGDLPLLRKLLKNRDSGVRSAVSEAIARVATHQDFAILNRLFKSHPRFAGPAILRVANHGDLPRFMRMLKSRDHWQRKLAVEAIVKLGEEPDLVALARNEAASSFSEDALAPAKALLLLDRRLYCPFPSIEFRGRYGIPME